MYLIEKEQLTIKINNPFIRIKNWFLYDKSFWRLHKIKRTRLGYNDISRDVYYTCFIRHKITNKTLSYDGWGDELLQKAIYLKNEKYELFEKCNF